MLSSGLCLLWVFLSLPILQHFMTSFPLLVLPCHFLITIIFLPYRLYSFLAASSTSFLTYLPSIFLLFVYSCFHPSLFSFLHFSFIICLSYPWLLPVHPSPYFTSVSIPSPSSSLPHNTIFVPNCILLLNFIFICFLFVCLFTCFYHWRHAFLCPIGLKFKFK